MNSRISCLSLVIFLISNIIYAGSVDYDKEINIIARTLILEGGNQSLDCIRGIASTIYNRSNGDPNNYIKIILKRYQYSCWNRISDDQRCDHNKIPYEFYYDHPKWDLSVELSRSMITGKFIPSISATHYYNPSLCSPRWGLVMRDEVVIGDHKFGIPYNRCKNL